MRGSFEYPKGGSDAVNWQGALVWRHAATGEWHASVSDRVRFPVIFELYSTRFGTATPNPGLGPERATNIELGWSRLLSGGARATAAVFHSDVRATYAFPRSLELSLGFKNLLDDDYELAWGFPQPGRTFHVKTRVVF